MSTAAALPTFSFQDLNKIREILATIRSIRELADPITTATGLQQAIALLEQLATQLGVNPQWIQDLNTILANPTVFNDVLAIVQYLSGLAGHEQPNGTLQVTLAGTQTAVTVDPQGFLNWLPLIAQILSILSQIRA
jgi:hypothetical protein